MDTVVQPQTQTKQQADKTKLNQIIFTIGIILTVSIVVQLISNYFYLDDVFATTAAKETTLGGIKTENARLANLEVNHSKLLVDAAKAENDYRLLQPLIPQRAELPKILDWVSSEAYSRGLKLESFEQNTLQQNTQQKVGQLQQVSVRATVSGEQSQIAKLLVDFARHERVLLVESVRVSEKEKNKEATQITTHKGEIIFSAFLGIDNGKLNAKQ